jgi:hydrogenase maturation protein HypF
MCTGCAAEYGDPTDRRYHAQPIACHDCGPRLAFRSSDPHGTDAFDDAIERAICAIDAGGVVAVKGLGGYHLACDATDATAVAALRRRKRRPDKPFAVMVRDLAHARSFAHVSEAEADLLMSPAAPIVLLRARSDSPLSMLVAPGNPLVGIMLAYTPVHHLLFAYGSSPLVMTSANRAGEPIAHRREHVDALTDLYDALLDHDRPIQTPCDDSVVRVVGDRLLPIRRARGYAPLPVSVGAEGRSVLAVGAELKNAFCVATGGHAWVSQHIGDMENLGTLRAFEANVQRFVEMYDVHPDVVAIDAHPGYLSSKAGRAWAQRLLVSAFFLVIV